MPLVAFDHVNIRTSKLEEMIRWYSDILGLKSGDRPPFGFDGAWMYLGDQAIVHLVDASDMSTHDDQTLEHFAFRAEGMKDFLAVLDDANIPYSVDDVPDFPVVQVNFFDPEGIHIHVDFGAAEKPD